MQNIASLLRVARRLGLRRLKNGHGCQPTVRTVQEHLLETVVLIFTFKFILVNIATMNDNL